MKHTLLFVILFLSVKSLAQEKFKVDTLAYNGDVSNRINVVILGDGFMVHELPKFISAANDFAKSFGDYDPFRQYHKYLNFFAISTPSVESGVTNPGTAPDAYSNHPVVSVNNFYGGTFGASIHRLVIASKTGVVYDVLANNFPQYDVVVIILNTTFYGGSGGAFATFTLNTSANLVGIHEIGHSFGRLSDEYWAGSQYARENVNMSKEQRHEHVRWKDWVGTAEIGVYPHGSTSDMLQWMKPARANCLMEVLDKPYCAVCREATVERIFSLVNPIDKMYPAVDSTVHVTQEQNFKLDLIEPNPNTLKVLWSLNGENIEGTNQVTLKPENLNLEMSTLTATVVDETPMSRKNPTLRTNSVTWNITGGASTKINIVPEKSSICVGENTILHVRGCSGNVIWGTGQTSNSITVMPSVSTPYTAQCNLSSGIVLYDTLSLTVVQYPKPKASNTGPYLELDVIKLQAEGGLKYEWSGPLGFTSKEQNPEIPNALSINSGTYRVNVWGEADCLSSTSTDVKVEILMSNEDEKIQVKVYPNPAQDFIRLDVPFEGLSTAILYSIDGKVLKNAVFEKSTSIKISDLSAGLYFIKVQNRDKQVVTKVTLL